jgi:mevalonate pyrophosphate decarboxylase
MNTKPKLKVKHKIEELISFIENNNLEDVKKMIESNTKLLKDTKMDDNQAIYYAIKYKCNKIFKFILDHSNEIKYDVSKIFNIINVFF